MEIEKKFLVRKLPENLTQYSVKHMEQGYLCTDPVLRIRKSNDRYILTYKSRIGLEGQEGVRVNQEIEAPLHKDRKSTRLNSSHSSQSRMPSSA